MRLRAHLQSVRALCIATAAIGLCGISTAQGKAKSPSIASQRPDVVFIVVDDLNDWIGAMHGHPQSLTSNLDAFAK